MHLPSPRDKCSVQHRSILVKPSLLFSQVSDQYCGRHWLLIVYWNGAHVGRARPLETLADIVALAYLRTGAPSSRELEAYARKYGHRLTHTTINTIASGTYAARPKEHTLRALAYLSGVEYNRVREAAGLRPRVGPSVAEQMPPDVDELEAEPRQALVELARVLLNLQRQARGVPEVDGETGVSVATLSDLGVAPDNHTSEASTRRIGHRSDK